MNDFTNKRFGRLVAIEPTEERTADRHVVWKCICDCGNECKVISSLLQNGKTQSCGCLHRERAGCVARHGHACRRQQSPEYCAFMHAKDRCTNSNYRAWRCYGGAGVLFLFKSFEEFLQSVGPKPKGTSLGRYADLSNYAPNECCWMTPAEQRLAAMNKKYLLAWAARAQEAA